LKNGPFDSAPCEENGEEEVRRVASDAVWGARDLCREDLERQFSGGEERISWSLWGR